MALHGVIQGESWLRLLTAAAVEGTTQRGHTRFCRVHWSKVRVLGHQSNNFARGACVIWYARADSSTVSRNSALIRTEDTSF